MYIIKNKFNFLDSHDGDDYHLFVPDFFLRVLKDKLHIFRGRTELGILSMPFTNERINFLGEIYYSEYAIHKNARSFSKHDNVFNYLQNYRRASANASWLLFVDHALIFSLCWTPRLRTVPIGTSHPAWLEIKASRHCGNTNGLTFLKACQLHQDKRGGYPAAQRKISKLESCILFSSIIYNSIPTLDSRF